MKPFINREGWTFNQHDRNKDLFTIPSETVFQDPNYRVYLSHIASSPGLTREVYFVDYMDKDAWITGYQCKNKSDALMMLELLKKELNGEFRS